MNKLFLLIFLMSFVSFQAIARDGSSGKSSGGKNSGVSGEEKIKQDCYKEAGGYGGNNPKSPYQLCLRAHGVIKVNRNISSEDSSQTDARVCDFRNPICKTCIGQHGSGDAKSARTKITECINAEERKQRQANQPKPKPKPKEDNTIYDGGRLQEVVVTAPVRRTCSKNYPNQCTTEAQCTANNGVWSGNACAMAPCPSGTTVDDSNNTQLNICKCDGENYSIERGSRQLCPSMCKAEDHKVYNIVVRGCVCAAGYEGDGQGTCVAKNRPPTNIEACMQELQDKVNSCGSAATVAVDQCDPKRKESSASDTIGSIQNLMQAGALATGAAENCGRAAIAGTTGYYAIEEVRNKCDSDINSCKSSCSDAESYINANKTKAYEKCRKDAYEDGICRMDGGPYQAVIGQEDTFNTRFDSANAAPFEQKVQQMLTTVSTDNTKCESGTAVTNRQKMTDFMDEMDGAFKGAAQCECQLGSSGANCANQPGPKDCSSDPTLPGCAKAQLNCLSGTDNSKQCICFRNPNSDECLDVRRAEAVRSTNSNVSGFTGIGGVGAKPVTAIGGNSGSGISQNSGTQVDPGDLSGLRDESEVTSLAGASGTAEVSGGGSPFGSATAAGGGGGGGGGGSSASGSAGVDQNAAAGEDGSATSGIKSFFNTAKSGISNLFNKKSKNEYDTSGGGYGRGGGANGDGNGVDAKKWRPRGMRRLAGGGDGDMEIAGKHEDIWKVMNKQYKVQDQKDNFIFGGEKN